MVGEGILAATVIPAKAGTHANLLRYRQNRIPAFA
jgi:hypothetical protein